MVEEHIKVKDLVRICNNIMPHKGSKKQQQQVGQRVDNQGQKRSNSSEDEMLTFIGENKRLLNIHD